LKTWPNHLVGYLPLDIALTNSNKSFVVHAQTNQSTKTSFQKLFYSSSFFHVFKIMAALVNSGTCNLRTCEYLADRAGPDVAAVALLLHNDGGCVELKNMP
jgi:hypothetical protein